MPKFKLGLANCKVKFFNKVKGMSRKNLTVETIKRLANKKRDTYAQLTNDSKKWNDFVHRDVANFILRKKSIGKIVKECPGIMDYVVSTDYFKNGNVSGNAIVSEVVTQIVSRTLTELDKNKENEGRQHLKLLYFLEYNVILSP